MSFGWLRAWLAQGGAVPPSLLALSNVHWGLAVPLPLPPLDSLHCVCVAPDMSGKSSFALPASTSPQAACRSQCLAGLPQPQQPAPSWPRALALLVSFFLSFVLLFHCLLFWRLCVARAVQAAPHRCGAASCSALSPAAPLSLSILPNTPPCRSCRPAWLAPRVLPLKCVH